MGALLRGVARGMTLRFANPQACAGIAFSRVTWLAPWWLILRRR